MMLTATLLSILASAGFRAAAALANQAGPEPTHPPPNPESQLCNLLSEHVDVVSDAVVPQLHMQARVRGRLLLLLAPVLLPWLRPPGLVLVLGPGRGVGVGSGTVRPRQRQHQGPLQRP